MQKRIKFKNGVLTRAKVRNNILKVWNNAGEADKYDWYKEAYDYAVKLSGLVSRSTEQNISKTAGIIAALSPLIQWERNKQLAKQLILDQRPEKLPCIKRNAVKAFKILHSGGTDEEIMDILKGPKVISFYLNIRYPDSAVSLTIDRHAIQIATGKKMTDPQRQITAGQYEFFVECYRWTAAQLNVNPLILQSATWLAYRRTK